jgi:hypothetical protein
VVAFFCSAPGQAIMPSPEERFIAPPNSYRIREPCSRQE